MKAKYLVAILFIICSQNVFAQLTFRKVFSDIPIDGMASAGDIKLTHDSGYIVTGLNFQSPSYGTFLMKLDINGDTIWTKHYDTGLNGNSVFQTCDGGYASIGNLIIKTNSTGDTLWTKSYSDIYSTSNCMTSDCGYMISGFTQSFGAGDQDVYIIKTDSSGHPLWSKAYGGDSTDNAFAIQETIDEGYIIAGYSNSFSLERRIYIIKTDNNGDTIWTKTYGSTDVIANSIQQTYDKGYVILGAFNSAALLMKIDSSGNVIWCKTYGGTPFISGFCVRQTRDSGFIFTGSIDYPVNVLYIKTDANGNLQWHHSFHVGNETNFGNSILQTIDGGYVIAGFGIDHHNQSSYIFVKKINATGLVNCFEQTPSITASTATIVASNTTTVVTQPSATESASAFPIIVSNMVIDEYTSCSNVSITEGPPEGSIKVYPNLVSKNGSVNIFLDEDFINAQVEVFNVMGVPVYKDILSGKGKPILLALNEKLSSGIYFVRIMYGREMLVQKIVVL